MRPMWVLVEKLWIIGNKIVWVGRGKKLFSDRFSQDYPPTHYNVTKCMVTIVCEM